jgi:hypothetical protein
LPLQRWTVVAIHIEGEDQGSAYSANNGRTTYFLKRTDFHISRRGISRNSDPTVCSFLLAYQRSKATAFSLELAVYRAHNILPQENRSPYPSARSFQEQRLNSLFLFAGSPTIKGHSILTATCLVAVDLAYNIHPQRTTLYLLARSLQEQRFNSLFQFEWQYNDR